MNNSLLNFENMKQTIRELCKIVAPSHFEDDRAKYCLNFVKAKGFINAYIDSAKNVVWKIEGKSSKAILFVAHTDTVFPDTTPMPFIEDEETMRCPGIYDNTANLVAMMYASCDLLSSGVKPSHTLIFSANSCEEGLGNLKGIKELCKNFGKDLDYMFSFDGSIYGIANKVVGSHRYKVNIKTPGGHSFAEFGTQNAIFVASQIVNDIYSIEVPTGEGEKTTYNVGIIKGGTSINTICQEVELLCEYRSTNIECLRYMEKKFKQIFGKNYADTTISVELVGERPCADKVDQSKLDKMVKTGYEIQKKYAQKEINIHSSSTDCNIPLSMGIPAICLGAAEGFGEHTREEYIVKEGIKKGYNICYEVIDTVSKW